MRCLYIHGSDRLTVLNIGCITCRTTHNDNTKNLLHALLQLLIDHFLIRYGKITKMNTFRCILVIGSYQILINLLCHKRNHWSCCLTDFNQCCIKRHIGIDLILFHSLGPETLTAAAYIPVTHFIHKIIKYPCGFGDSVIIQVVIYFLYCRVQLGKQPLIHNRELIIF